jgi:NADPH2:quinone reductase
VVGVFWGAYSLNNPKVLIDSLKTLLGWQAEGKLTPHVSQTFPLQDAPEAIWTLMRRQAVGKIVVTM